MNRRRQVALTKGKENGKQRGRGKGNGNGERYALKVKGRKGKGEQKEIGNKDEGKGI